MKLIKYVLAFALTASSFAYTDESSLDKLKAALDKAGDKVEEMTKALQDYDWKGAYHNATTFGPVSFSDVTVNGQTRAAAVQPGEKIAFTATVSIDQEKMKNLKLKKVLVGIKDARPEASFSISGNPEQKETFTLTAPQEPGLYQIRYRPVVSGNDEWLDAEGNPPSFTHTIAMIWVKKPKAPEQ